MSVICRYSPASEATSKTRGIGLPSRPQRCSIGYLIFWFFHKIIKSIPSSHSYNFHYQNSTLRLHHHEYYSTPNGTPLHILQLLLPTRAGIYPTNPPRIRADRLPPRCVRPLSRQLRRPTATTTVCKSNIAKRLAYPRQDIKAEASASQVTRQGRLSRDER